MQCCPMDTMDTLNGCRPAPAASLPRGDGAPDLSKLKRMPHLFPRVLELPLHAETPVSVMESRDCYSFQIWLPGVVVDEVEVEVLEIVPGATKVLVRGVHDIANHVPEENFWRFRLPPTTVPEKSVASYEQGFLSVTIPKSFDSCDDDDVLESQWKDDGDVEMDADSSDTENEFETEEERMQRKVLEHLDSFGSPRARSSPRRSRRSSSSSSSSDSPSPRESLESEVDLEKLQMEVLEHMESFGSPRRRSASCTQSSSMQSSGSGDFFRSVGSWVGGFTISVQ